MKKIFKNFTPLLLIIFIVVYIGHALVNQSVLAPENPIDGIAKNSSRVLLSSNDFIANAEENNDEDSEEKSEEKDIESNNKSTENEQKPQEPNENDSGNSDAEKDEIDPESPNIEIVDPENATEKSNKSKENEYFTTSIVQNEIVTHKEYSFVIKQKNHGLTVVKTEVFLNNKLVSDFKGTVKLEEDKNTIKVKVTYQDDDAKVFSVSKTYTVYLNTKDIVIYSSLKDNMKVTKADLVFTASAKKKGKDIPVAVQLNGKEVKEENKNHYNITLDEGENKILISASDSSGKTEKESFLVIYDRKDTKLKIITDLKDQEVDVADFSFNAVAKYGKDKAKLSAECNGKILYGDDKDNYSLTLVEGDNHIILKAQKGEDTLFESYTVVYRRLSSGENGEDEIDEKAPKLITDLEDGVTAKTKYYTFEVQPVDYKGNRIRGKNVSVTCNAKGVPFVWDDSTKTSYKLNLKDGLNQIIISIWDSEGRVTTETFHITGNIAEKGEVIGTATISVEATTIGAGYIIPPTKVEVRQGEPASYVFDRLLKENGFNYQYTGTLDSAFYLKGISKEGMLPNPVIPEDLAKLVEKESTTYDPNKYDPNSLGEFDFANGSGWMYSVNGNYLNYGFSDCFLRDGDVMRIRYTLHYGKDIGGFGSLGGGSKGNWHKEW